MTDYPQKGQVLGHMTPFNFADKW